MLTEEVKAQLKAIRETRGSKARYESFRCVRGVFGGALAGTGASTSTGCSSIPLPSAATRGTGKRQDEHKIMTVLASPPVTSAEAAVKVAIAAKAPQPEGQGQIGTIPPVEGIGSLRSAESAGLQRQAGLVSSRRACPAVGSGCAEESRSRRPCCDRVCWKCRRVLSIWRLSSSNRAGSREPWQKTQAKAHAKGR